MEGLFSWEKFPSTVESLGDFKKYVVKVKLGFSDSYGPLSRLTGVRDSFFIRYIHLSSISKRH